MSAENSQRAHDLAKKMHAEKNPEQRKAMMAELKGLAKAAREKASSQVTQQTRKDLEQTKSEAQKRIAAAKTKVTEQKSKTQKYIRSAQGNTTYWKKVMSGDKNIMAGRSEAEQAELKERAKKMIQGSTQNVERYGQKLRQVEKAEQGIALMSGQAAQLETKGARGVQDRVQRAEEMARSSMTAKDIHTDVVMSRRLRNAAEKIRDDEARKQILRMARDVKLTKKDQKMIDQIADLGMKTDAESTQKLQTLVAKEVGDLAVRRANEYDMSIDAASYQFRRNEAPRVTVDGTSYEVDVVSGEVYALDSSKKRTTQVQGDELLKVKSSLLAGGEQREQAAKEAYTRWWNEVKDLDGVDRNIRIEAMRNIFDRTTPFSDDIGQQALDEELEKLINGAKVSARKEVMRPTIDQAYLAIASRAAGSRLGAGDKNAFNSDLVKTVTGLEGKSAGDITEAMAKFAEKYGVHTDDLAKYVSVSGPALGIAASAAGKMMLAGMAGGAMNTIAGVGFWKEVLEHPENILADGQNLVLDVAPVTGTYREYKRAEEAFAAGDVVSGWTHAGFTLLSGTLDAVTLVPAATGVLAAPAAAANMGIRTLATTVFKNGVVKVTEVTLSKEALAQAAKSTASATFARGKKVAAGIAQVSKKDLGFMGAKGAVDATKFSGKVLSTAGKGAVEVGVNTTKGVLSLGKEITKASLKDAGRTTESILTLGAKDWMTVYRLAKQGKVMTPEASRFLGTVVKSERVQLMSKSTETKPVEALPPKKPESTEALNKGGLSDQELVNRYIANNGTRIGEDGVVSPKTTSKESPSQETTSTEKEYAYVGSASRSESGGDQFDGADLQRTQEVAGRKSATEKQEAEFEQRMKEAREKREAEERAAQEKIELKKEEERLQKDQVKRAREKQLEKMLQSDPDYLRIQKVDFLGRRDQSRARAEEILGVSQQASKEEAKAAMRTLTKKLHPDKYSYSSDSQRAELDKAIGKVTQAYNYILKNTK